MTPKLYLIESEEREGLVKIGFAGAGDNAVDGDAVYARVRKYAVGLSDTSSVYETPGAQTFEKYFHALVSEKRKPINIRFRFLEKSYRPIEWFTLSPEVSKLLIDAFSKDHPTHIEQVSLTDIPAFLSGAMSAIRWHAERISSLELAEMSVREEVLSNLEGEQLVQLRSQEDGDYDSLPKTTVPLPLLNLESHDFIRSIAQAERLKVEISEIEQMESHRTIIALVSATIIFILLITGGLIAGCLFAILASLTYSFWPIIQPIGASTFVDLANWLKKSSKESRHRTDYYDE